MEAVGWLEATKGSRELKGELVKSIEKAVGSCHNIIWAKECLELKRNNRIRGSKVERQVKS